MVEICSKQSAVVDRIVDQVSAVLLVKEGQEQLIVSTNKLPPGTKEGTWLLITTKGDKILAAELDQVKTEEIKDRIASKRALLLERMARRKKTRD